MPTLATKILHTTLIVSHSNIALGSYKGWLSIYFVTTIISTTHLRKALRSLQNASGVYGLVVPSAEVRYPDMLVGHLIGGETLRTVLPKNEGGTGRQKLGIKGIESNASSGTKSVPGYGVKLTFDVPQGKHNGVLDVKVCWHNIVYQAQVDFGVKFLRF